MYGRIVAKSFLASGEEIGAEVINASIAWYYRKYSLDTNLAMLEEHARSNGQGL